MVGNKGEAKRTRKQTFKSSYKKTAHITQIYVELLQWGRGMEITALSKMAGRNEERT